MGIHGNIIIYPKKGNPPLYPSNISHSAVRAFERLNLFRQGTSDSAQPSELCSVTFENYLEDGTLQAHEYAHIALGPECLSENLSKLIYLLDVDENNKKTEITLPYVGVTVLTRSLDIVDFISGTKIARTWAAIEFSYEDARLCEEIHRIRDVKHPIFNELAMVFDSPMGWGVVCF